MSTPGPTRVRNARGEGGKLRGDLLRGAQRILEQTASEDAVTLRAVAREAGVSAPSIYAHFADSQAIIDALVQQTFDQLSAALRDARDRQAAAGDRLLAICLAYISFGTEHPELYLTLFGRRRSTERTEALVASGRPFEGTSGAEAFGILADGVATLTTGAGRPAEEEAALLWAALHGYVTLTAGLPTFPWFPGPTATCEVLIARLPRP